MVFLPTYILGAVLVSLLANYALFGSMSLFRVGRYTNQPSINMHEAYIQKQRRLWVGVGVVDIYYLITVPSID